MSERTLESGWDALWFDLQHRTKDIHGCRQAYKNGAAIIAARLQVRGRPALLKMIELGGDEILQACWPLIMRTVDLHEDWGEPQRDATVAGVFAALMLVRLMEPLVKQVEEFRVNEILN